MSTTHSEKMFDTDYLPLEHIPSIYVLQLLINIENMNNECFVERLEDVIIFLLSWHAYRQSPKQ